MASKLVYINMRAKCIYRTIEYKIHFYYNKNSNRSSLENRYYILVI